MEKTFLPTNSSDNKTWEGPGRIIGIKYGPEERTKGNNRNTE